jgi:hypothetical protein
VLGEAEFEKIHRPSVVDEQRASALRLDDPRSRALLAALLAFTCCPVASPIVTCESTSLTCWA